MLVSASADYFSRASGERGGIVVLCRGCSCGVGLVRMNGRFISIRSRGRNLSLQPGGLVRLSGGSSGRDNKEFRGRAVRQAYKLLQWI